MPSTKVVQKAERLYKNDQVDEVVGVRVFRVKGDSDSYYVTVGDNFTTCTCQWFQNNYSACSHILAAGHFENDCP